MKKESLQEMVSIFEPSVDDGPCIFIFTERLNLLLSNPIFDLCNPNGSLSFFILDFSDEKAF